MNDNSTISWMIMGGPRYDEHSQAELDQRRALEEQHRQATLARSNERSGGWLTRLVGFVDSWTARPSKALTADFCSVESCLAG
jgi:hypothetical protein